MACNCSGSCNCAATTLPVGPQGDEGAQGVGIAIAVTAEPVGPNCSNGGFKIDVY